jgi:hypothetical protein
MYITQIKRSIIEPVRTRSASAIARSLDLGRIMRIRVGSVLLVALMAVTAAIAVEAQSGGFMVGVTQPPPSPPAPVINSPVLPFVTSPVQPAGRFGTTFPITPPILTTTYSPIYSNSPAPAIAVGVPLIYSNGFQGSPVTIIVPNGTVITNSTVIIQQPHGQFFSAAPFATRTLNPVPGFQPPSFGTTRAQVIQQMGSPVSSIVTQQSETFYFSGGTSVVLKDGKVVNPQRPN